MRDWRAQTMSEGELQYAILDCAEQMKWISWHDNDSRRNKAGFPDLVLVRDRVIFAELKSQHGKPRLEQALWLKALEKANTEVYLWKPEHWLNGEIEAILR